MTLVERFLKYVSFDTQSNEESGVTPSTPGQMVFARFLKEELEALGLEEITLDENGYLFATLPANIDKSVPVVGFIAHMDTSPDMSGKDVSPRIVENYDGKDIVLCADEQVVLSPARFPELLDHKGEDLIVTNGKTLLGADDKAGIAEDRVEGGHIALRNEHHGDVGKNQDGVQGFKKALVAARGDKKDDVAHGHAHKNDKEHQGQQLFAHDVAHAQAR